ncbi:MAG: MerR family transcriptional regulator [Desulforhopalus sp.]|nr:MerR family transcriptional regulator [Desulforhopalus sp.]
MTAQIPNKLYFKIGEVAKLAEVPAHVLRYWESEFPGIKPKRANSQQRLYRYQDVELILKIKVLLHDQRYTIAGARKLLGTTGGEPVPQPTNKRQSRENQPHKLQIIKKELQKLQSLLNKPKE